MAVLDAGRLLYLCMEKSNRRENVNGKKREKGIAERCYAYNYIQNPFISNHHALFIPDGSNVAPVK